MSSEEQSSLPGNSEILINLPSSLRIRQRLGQVSSNHLFQQHLVPRVEQLGGETMTAQDFLGHLALELASFADEYMVGVTMLAYNQMPSIIDQIVDDKQQKEATLNLWEAMVIEKKERDAAEISAIKNRFVNPHPKLPRKLKKRQRGYS
jgi:hypothetical protein